MRQRQIGPRGTLGTRFLIIGFASTLLLSVLTLGIAAVELDRVEQAALETADDSYSGYHLINLGEDLAQLRTHVTLGLSESPEEFARRADRITELEARLQTAMAAVPAALDPASQARWNALRPQLERLRQIYAEASSAIRAGRAPLASELLAQEAPMTRSVHEALDGLEHAHRHAVLRDLRAVHRNAASTAVVEIALAAVFLIGMIGIFGIMLRLLRRQQRRLAEYTERLEAANADLDAFAGRVAHDLRNALGPIVMAPSLLRGSPTDQALVLRTADRTERSSRRAIAILDTLLAFSRASRDVKPDESGDVRSAVRDVVEELEPLIARLGASIELGDLPDVRVRCSPALLHIVLGNVCGNAVKYLEGQPERRVRISAHREGAACRIEVEDTGPGIPKEAQDKIFEPFVRVEGSLVAGSGIGLATVRRILDARGGRITVESDMGRGGARFQIWLPLAPPPSEPPPSHEPSAR